MVELVETAGISTGSIGGGLREHSGISTGSIGEGLREHSVISAGWFGLAMAVDDRVIAPVAAGELRAVGLRFTDDKVSPPERFQYLKDRLGDAFLAIEIDSAHGNPHPAMEPHSVLTEHLVDEPGQPTREALDTVLDFFADRLLRVCSTARPPVDLETRPGSVAPRLRDVGPRGIVEATRPPGA